MTVEQLTKFYNQRYNGYPVDAVLNQKDFKLLEDLTGFNYWYKGLQVLKLEKEYNNLASNLLKMYLDNGAIAVFFYPYSKETELSFMYGPLYNYKFDSIKWNEASEQEIYYWYKILTTYVSSII